MRVILDDVRYSLKTLRRAPGFTGIVILVMALGIGASSAIFSVLNAMVVRAVPFPDGHRVLSLAWRYSDYVSPDLTSAKFAYWREHTRTFAAFASWQPFYGREGRVGEVSGVHGLKVTQGFFDVLGLRPSVGRDFTEEEYRTGGPKVALVTRAFWRKRFSEPVDLSGSSVVMLEDELHTIVGLLPDAFSFPYEAEPIEIIIPTAMAVDPNDESANWPALVRPGGNFTEADARAEVTSLNAGFRAAYPQQVGEQDIGMTVGNFAQLYVGQTAKAVWILMAAVGAVLLIACANVGILFLARALRRRGETAVHAAFGATPARIMRLGLIEALLVAFAAAALGIILARWSVTLLVALAPVRLPFAGPVGIDWRVVAFTVFVALAAAIVVSGIAAWPGAREGLWQAMGRSSRRTTSGGWLQEALLSGQTALSMLLLVGAGLLVATWSNLSRVEPGFDPDGLMAVRLPIRPPSYDTSERLWQFEKRVIEEVSASAGSLVAVAGASSLPFERGLNFPISIAGRAEFGGSVELRVVTPGYFQTLGIELIRGRPFSEADVKGAANVAIVNETFARAYFPESNAIGQRIDLGRRGNTYRYPSLEGRGTMIVGVATDVQDVSLRTPARRTMYLPQVQAADMLSNIRPTMPVFIVRSTLPRSRLEQEFREGIRNTDPSLPGPELFALSESVVESLARERFGAVLMTLFGALALILTATGIYSVLAYSVRGRRREIGIRMALGARSDQVFRLVVVRGLLPIAIGIVAGLSGAVAFSRLLEAYLWGVASTDPVTLSAVAAGVLGVATIACWIPGREAATVDPVNALTS